MSCVWSGRAGGAAEVQAVWVGAAREPFGFILVSPTSSVVGLSVTDVIAEFARGLERDTSFRVQSEDARAAMSACSGALDCLVDRFQSAGIRFFAVLSHVATADQASRLSSTLVDGVRYSSDSSAGVTRTRVRTVASRGEATSYLNNLVALQFQSALDEAGRWQAPGRVEVSALQKGSAVLVDGEVVATTGALPVRLFGLSPGPHRVGLSHPDYLDAERAVEVVSNQPVEVTLSSFPWSGARPALFWTGSAVAVAGVAVAIYGVVQGVTNDSQAICLVPAGSAEPRCSSQSVFTTVDGAGARRGKLLTAPLGYSLLAAGLGPALASVISDSEWAPWIGLAVGVAAGGLAYGISAALDGETVIDAIE